ncbi:MAG TPA: hypothetical protein VHK01_12935 [Lacipirellulaceae bacterium]|jgi:hypothetical protein|nr:hypothetical protein [Lacipirellulaceae bacterium]
MSARQIRQRSGIAALSSNPPGALLVAALLSIVIGVVGCNGGRKPGTARLEGQITLDGQPPPAGAVGSISFRATGQGQAASTSAQIVDGEYKCDNVPLGDVVVFVQLILETGKTITEGGRSYPERRNLVSPKHDQKGIELKVTDDNSNQDFDLEGNTIANN